MGGIFESLAQLFRLDSPVTKAERINKIKCDLADGRETLSHIMLSMGGHLVDIFSVNDRMHVKTDNFDFDVILILYERGDIFLMSSEWDKYDLRQCNNPVVTVSPTALDKYIEAYVGGGPRYTYSRYSAECPNCRNIKMTNAALIRENKHLGSMVCELRQKKQPTCDTVQYIKAARQYESLKKDMDELLEYVKDGCKGKKPRCLELYLLDCMPNITDNEYKRTH